MLARSSTSRSKEASGLTALAHDLVSLMRFHRAPLQLTVGTGPMAMAVVAFPLVLQRPV